MKQKGHVYTPGYKRHTFLKIVLIFAIGFAAGVWRNEILEKTAEGIEIARSW